MNWQIPIEGGGMSHWPDPTPEMLKDPLFNAIWEVIKTWDVNVPQIYGGYCGATGNHARAIFDAVRPFIETQYPPNEGLSDK